MLESVRIKANYDRLQLNITDFISLSVDSYTIRPIHIEIGQFLEPCLQLYKHNNSHKQLLHIVHDVPLINITLICQKCNISRQITVYLNQYLV